MGCDIWGKWVHMFYRHDLKHAVSFRKATAKTATGGYAIALYGPSRVEASLAQVSYQSRTSLAPVSHKSHTSLTTHKSHNTNLTTHKSHNTNLTTHKSHTSLTRAPFLSRSSRTPHAFPSITRPCLTPIAPP